MGGTYWEGPPSMSPIGPSGGARPLEMVKGKELSEWAIQSWTAHFKLDGPFESNGLFE